MNAGSPIDLLLRRLTSNAEAGALATGGELITYGRLGEEVEEWRQRIRDQGIGFGEVAGFSGDFSLPAIGFVLASLAEGSVAALIPQDGDRDQYLADGCVSHFFHPDGSCSAVQSRWPASPLLNQLRDEEQAGFIIFSSGSSGTPKAILHSANRFLTKFETASKRFRTLAFLIFDHIAGLDTLFYSLFSGGLLVVPEGRTPAHICDLIDTWKVEVLPTSPSFLNLLLLSGAAESSDLSSLKVITYGSEPMPPHTLERLNQAFPGVSLVQKYGTSEFGSPSSRSRGDDELWIKLESDTFHTRVEDGILWVRSPTTMLGYLNAPFEITEDGWLNTGDRVEVDGEWVRILGRDSELINVGGEKAFPAEIEAVLSAHPAVEDVLVRGEPNPILGVVVVALVRPVVPPEDAKELRKELRRWARERLAPWKVPARFTFVHEPLSGIRQKKERRRDTGEG